MIMINVLNFQCYFYLPSFSHVHSLSLHSFSLSLIITFRSKDDADTVGIDGLRRVCEAVQIPVVSIGGVNAQNAGETIKAGAGKR